MYAATALVALVLDRLFGYPPLLQRTIGHPVEWIGWMIGAIETRLNQPRYGDRLRRLLGIAMLVAVCAMAGAVAIMLSLLFSTFPYGWLAEALVASAFLAQKQLGDMVAAVAAALARSLPEARVAVGHIVGRDTTTLDEAEISRAAIETLAENASDGVIAPLFWLVIFGLPGIVVYKVINTADSMVGHLDERYRQFGWASARTDDLANWIPARLTALLFVAASAVLPGASPQRALATAFRDAGRHRSPNAGWPESAMAGALGFGLGGPRSYEGRMVDLPAMGDGRRDLAAADIGEALRLYRLGCGLAVMATALLATVLVSLP